jgi:hypothetical protein
MFLHSFFISFLLSPLVICRPPPSVAWEHVESRQTFTLEEKAIRPKAPWSHKLRKTYLKYGVTPPQYIEEAIGNYESDDFGAESTSVEAKSFEHDVEYVVDAQVGNLNLTLNLDTGSADLYDFL